MPLRSLGADLPGSRNGQGTTGGDSGTRRSPCVVAAGGGGRGGRRVRGKQKRAQRPACGGIPDP